MSPNTLPTAATTARNPFLAYSEAMTRRIIDGETLKFNKGDFLAGKDAVVVPTGTELVAVMDSLMVGWIKWRGGKPVDGRMGFVIDGFVPPRRRDLDDFESDLWEAGKDGDLRDPWQLTNTLVLIDPAAKAIYTFSTASRGGFDAIAKLCKTHAKAPAGTYPVIRLEVGSYQHQDRSIGKVKFPIFETGKKVASALDFDSVLAASRGETEALTAPTEAPEAIEHDAGEPIDDEIPF
jgi:hypothetical protein